MTIGVFTLYDYRVCLLAKKNRFPVLESMTFIKYSRKCVLVELHMFVGVGACI